MICEKRFQAGLVPCNEWDFYQSIPVDLVTERVPNHRLTLTYDRRTEWCTVYRAYFDTEILHVRGAVVLTGKDIQATEICFQGLFNDAVKFANDEKKRYRGIPYVACEHKPPKIDSLCPNANMNSTNTLTGFACRKTTQRYRLNLWKQLTDTLKRLRS